VVVVVAAANVILKTRVWACHQEDRQQDRQLHALATHVFRRLMANEEKNENKSENDLFRLCR
jgi:hypothetical protein